MLVSDKKSYIYIGATGRAEYRVALNATSKQTKLLINYHTPHCYSCSNKT